MNFDPNRHFPLLTIAIIAGILLFTPVCGTAVQVTTSAVSYIGMSIWALGDLIFNNGNGAWADMNRINWNPFNSNESAVLNSNNISFYKGVPVFLKNSDRFGSYYAISLNRHDSVDDLRHERGHNWQAMMMGIATYGGMIGLSPLFDGVKEVIMIVHGRLLQTLWVELNLEIIMRVILTEDGGI